MVPRLPYMKSTITVAQFIKLKSHFQDYLYQNMNFIFISDNSNWFCQIFLEIL